MAFKLEWDAAGKHFYETGISRGVLYTMKDTITPTAGTLKGSEYYNAGVEWNGLTSVSETPEGGDPTDVYADNIKYLTLIGKQTFSGSLECYTYPDDFNACIGEKQEVSGLFYGQQARKKFALCYRTEIGNDLKSDAGYKIHIVYGCYAGAPSRDYATINDSPEANTMSFDFSADPISDKYCASQASTNGVIVTAIVTLDSTVIGATKMAAIEEKLYGKAAEGSTDAVDGVVLFPNEIETILAAN